jgi:hypothetical protein
LFKPRTRDRRMPAARLASVPSRRAESIYGALDWPLLRRCRAGGPARGLDANVERAIPNTHTNPAMPATATPAPARAAAAATATAPRPARPFWPIDVIALVRPRRKSGTDRWTSLPAHAMAIVSASVPAASTTSASAKGGSPPNTEKQTAATTKQTLRRPRVPPRARNHRPSPATTAASPGAILRSA